MTAHRHRGVTLIEATIVIAIVSIVVALSIPALRVTRGLSSETRNLANIRASVGDFLAYAAEHQGDILNPGLPTESPLGPFYVEQFSVAMACDVYRGFVATWPRLMASWHGEAQAHWHAAHEEFTVNGRIASSERDEFWGSDETRLIWSPTRYRLSEPLITKAALWTNPRADADRVRYPERFARRVNLADIAHPSAKGFLAVHDYGAKAQTEDMVAMADGSSRLALRSEAAPTAVPPTSSSNTPGAPVRATLNGYRGRDY